MFTEAQNLAITRTELDEVFFQEFEYDASDPGIATARTAELFKPIDTDSSAYIFEINKGSGLFPIIGETQSVPLSTPIVANKTFAYIKDFAQGINISKDLFDDNKHGVWGEEVKDFALKARVTQDAYAFGIWRGAFTTTIIADGTALVASHNLIGGGTYSNLLTSPSPLTVPNLDAGIVAMRQQVDQANVILGNVPTILLVPSKLRTHAIQITQSALVADSANNNVNVYRSVYGFTVYSSPYMDAVAGGSDTAWFLLSRNHKVFRLVRQGIETALTPWQYSTNRTYFYQANFREQVFAADYIGVIGSTGV